VTFRHDDRFDASQPLSVECRVRFDTLGEMPVVISHGQWNQSGWFLQQLGGRWRWHLSGTDCDGGHPTADRWIHIAAIYDGTALKLYEDGNPVAESPGPINPAAWSGDLFIGQYSGGPGPQYQTTGHVTGVKIYHRALTAEEVAAAAKSLPE